MSGDGPVAGDWAGAWLASFEAWVGPADAAAVKEARAWRLWHSSRDPGAVEGDVTHLRRKEYCERVRLNCLLLPEGVVAEALNALGLVVTKLQGTRGQPARAALRAKIAALSGGEDLVPARWEVACTCGAGDSTACVHVRAAVRDFASTIRARPADFLELRAGWPLSRSGGAYEVTRGVRAAPAEGLPPPGEELGAFWLGAAEAERHPARSSGSGGLPGAAGPRVGLPARITPPPQWADAGAEIAAAMRGLCAALASVDDGRDVEADIVAAGGQQPTPDRRRQDGRRAAKLATRCDARLTRRE